MGRRTGEFTFPLQDISSSHVPWLPSANLLRRPFRFLIRLGELTDANINMNKEIRRPQSIEWF